MSRKIIRTQSFTFKFYHCLWIGVLQYFPFVTIYITICTISINLYVTLTHIATTRLLYFPNNISKLLLYVHLYMLMVRIFLGR